MLQMCRKNKHEAKTEYEAALSVDKFDEKSECRLGSIAYLCGRLEGIPLALLSSCGLSTG